MPLCRRLASACVARCATRGSSTHRAGSRSISLRPTSARPARRSISRWRWGSCSARNRSRPVPGGWHSSASCRSAARSGPCRASCRWWPSCRGAVCDGSWSRPPRSTRRGSSRGSRWSASRRCSMRWRSSGRDAPDGSRPRRDGSSWSRRPGRPVARARLPVPPGPPPSPVRTCARCAARSRRGAGWRSRWPVVTACCSSGRLDRARRCWRGRSPGCCRRSAMPRPWRRPWSRRPPARVRSPSSGDGRRSGRRITPSRTPAMVGGGPNMSPGEITRADQGVLFLDELPEFGRDVLEALRQPMEEGRVAVSRVGRATIFPARFQLVAAMNPCPCGFAGSSDRAVQLPCARPRALPATDLRSVARPDRPVDLDAAGRAAGARARSRAGGLGGRRGTDRGGTGRCPWTPERHAQRPPERTCAARRLPPRSRHGASHRPACRPGAGQRPRNRTACCGSRARSRISPGSVAVGEAHLDEAAWFRPADMRLAAAEVV